MITLNIIPENLKRELKFRQFYQSFKKFLAVMFLFTVFYSISMLGALYIIQQHFIDTTFKTNLIIKSTENYTSKVKNINSQLNAIESIQVNFIKWSSLIKYLVDKTNNGIDLSRLF